MPLTKKIQIVKTEGNWSQKSVSWYIFSNQKLLQVVNPLTASEKREVELSVSDVVELRIKDSPRSDIAGVNIPVQLLTASQYWVPLFPPSRIETLKNIPKEVPLPRMLIQVLEGSNDELFASYCEPHADPFESFASEIVMASLIDSPGMDSEELFGRSDLKAKCKKQAVVIKVLSKQLENTNEKNGQLQKKIENTEAKLLKINESLAVNVDNANEREKTLLELIQGKDSEIHQVLSLNMALQGKLRFVENEKEHLKDQVHRMDLEIERLRDLEIELEIANSKVNKSENIQDQLNKTLLKLSKSMYEPDDEVLTKFQSVEKDQEIQMLKNISEEVKKSADMQIISMTSEINDLKNLLNISKEQEKCLALKLASCETIEKSHAGHNIDESFAEALKKLKLQNFTKLKEFTYQVKGKVVSIALCRGGIFAKVGSSLLNLEEFLSDVIEKNEPVYLKTDTSFASRTERSVENEKSINRNSSQKSFLKSTQSSLSKFKPIEKIPLKDRNRVKSTDRRPFK